MPRRAIVLLQQHPDSFDVALDVADLTPRPLSPGERAALIRIVETAEVDGIEELRLQVPHAEVSGGPTFLVLQVREPAPRSRFHKGHLPVRAFVRWDEGDSDGELLVWVNDGYLSALEFAWYADEQPHEFPPIDDIRVEPEDRQ